MFKLVEVIKLENNDAVGLCYADTAAELEPTVVYNGSNLTLTKGSLAYLGSGKVYVLGDTWAPMGA